MNRVTVFGAGSWGTALAIQLSRSPDNEVTLWGHQAEAIEVIKRDQSNQAFLPGIPLSKSIKLTADLEQACQHMDYALIVIPSYAFVDFCTLIKPFTAVNTPIFWATKGFDLKTGSLLHEAVLNQFPKNSYGIVSGPTFALEVAKGLPTAITCAGSDVKVTRAFAKCLHYDNFRCYLSSDVVGVEIGGALKNILAIAVGITDGLGLGANSRAALMTRGLAEVTRYGLSVGGHAETFMGLAGLGDLVLTCTDNLSRNRRFGLLIGAGKSNAEAEQEVGQTVEGVRAAEAMDKLMAKKSLDLPIMLKVCDVLLRGKDPMQALKELQERTIKTEGEFET
ncbi:MAG: NAD(P)-dependent glycerol-3-phosphate dehydrogenase [Gammaproteobacteria bacterium]|nr:NAD(P)-dependent glycerol-3-phosphate dehydrogenase [Gammaproteobacteria bacterium]